MVLLVIEVQKGITDERLYGFHQINENLKTLIAASRKYGVEVFYADRLTQYANSVTE